MEATRRLRTAVVVAAAGALALGATATAGTQRPAANETLRVALDWVPNTDHSGVYVAQAKGWFARQGIDVKLIPYSGVNPDVLVNAGKADLGFTALPSVVVSRAQGLKLKAVGAVMTNNHEAIGVLASSRFKRPRDLAQGTTYGGFGAPYEVPLWQEVIRRDGGKPTFKTAVLSTAAYEALYAKKVDWSDIWLMWSGIDAKQRGIKLRLFPLKKYLGDFPTLVMIASDEKLAKRGDLIRRGLKAISDGYVFASKNPAATAKILTAAAPELGKSKPLVTESAAYLAPHYTENGRWGRLATSDFATVAAVLAKSGALKAPGGGTARSPRVADLWTNAYLPGGSG